MPKGFRNILIAIAIMLCAVTGVSATPEYTVSGAMITEYNGNADIVTVPAVIDGVEIAGIETGAFLNKDMHTVIVEDGIEVIQPKAFVCCKNLQYVKSPESMLLINEDAFFECNPWMGLDVAEGTYVMGMEAPVMLLSEDAVADETTGETEAFEFLYSGNTITGYGGTATDVIIPDYIDGVKITSIGASAFENNTQITSVVIPDTVTSIGNYAFKGCTALLQVTLPAKLSSAGVETFMNCTSLLQVTIPGTLKIIAKNMFYGCSGLKEVVIENGATSIAGYAFYNCVNLENITIPDTVTKIETWCFGFCKLLKWVNIPSKCTFVDSAVFYYCLSINNLHFPDTVTSIGTHCFRECWALTDITLSKSITSIQYRAFHNCPFAEIELPDGLTSIGKEAFYQCVKLKTLIIPKAVTAIGAGAFYGCAGLEKLIICSPNTALTDIFIFGGQTSMGSKTILYVIKDSVPEQYAEENSIPYVYMSESVNVVETQYMVNGAEIQADGETEINENDVVSVTYTVINAGMEVQDLCLLICLYNENRELSGFSYTPYSLKFNGMKEMEIEITSEDNDVYAKVMLWDSLQGLTPLFDVKEI